MASRNPKPGFNVEDIHNGQAGLCRVTYNMSEDDALKLRDALAAFYPTHTYRLVYVDRNGRWFHPAAR